jgi:hypothetical protein
MKITKLSLGNYMIPIGLLLDEMNHENSIGKKKIGEINIEHKKEIWKIKKLK